MRCCLHSLHIAPLGVVGILAVGGCTTHHYKFTPDAAARLSADEVFVYDADHARELPMFAGRTGQRVSWNDLERAIAWADAIIVGEEHDDPVGHAVELAVVHDTLSDHPGGALSMEMLERDDQDVVDDFLDGIVDSESLEKQTLSTNWGGEGKWVEWYQPMLDCAKQHEARIVAANAPRRYVRLARTDGYDRLRELPPERRKLFDLPGPLKDQSYVDRFIAVMSEDSHEPSKKWRTQAEVEDIMGAQLVWDATMGASIAKAKRKGATKVVHIVGQFHSDYNGGTVQEARRHLPFAKILTITMQRDEPTALRDEDRDRADVVIYTGKRPPEEVEAEHPATAPEASTQPTTAPAASQPGS